MAQGEGVAERASRVYAVDMNRPFPTRDEIHRAFQEGEEAIMERLGKITEDQELTAAFPDIACEMGTFSTS
jgi:hypothetical protein